MTDNTWLKKVYGTSKLCSMCRVKKPLVAFNKHHAKGQELYLDSYCRECRSRFNKSPEIREYQKIRARLARATKKKDSAKLSRTYRSKNPQKVHAHEAVKRAVKKGAIKRTPCVICRRKENVHAHHSDYSKPLLVIFLCPIHHAEVHKKATK